MPNLRTLLGTFSFFFLGTLSLSAQNVTNQYFTPAMQKMQIAQMAIRALYVDTVNENKLVEEGIRAMLLDLDPHSAYSDPVEVKELNEPLQGNFDGIGVQFQMMDDTLLVIQTVADGPSEKVGILAGDRIVLVNDSSIAGQKMSNRDIVSRLRGAKGTAVRLSILRRGVIGLIPFVVIRDQIPINSITAHYLVTPTIGYIRIDRFAATTHEEFLKAVADLRDKGMKDLIIDLESNGGGYLNAAIDMANEFLDKNQVIVYTEGRAQPRSDFFAHGNGTLRNIRVVVMVNDYSASASEIFSGALQDWDRGVIVGRRTFGKGLVQRPINLPDGSMIRLTTARYYTPAGRCIQKPYEKSKKGKEEYLDDIELRFKHGEMMNADSIHFADSLKCYTHKLHRTVYSGGGIMPDVFVPLDTTENTMYYRKLVAYGLQFKAASRYVDNHREELKTRYSSVDQFKNQFEVPEELLEEMKKDAQEKKVEFNETQYSLSKALIKHQIKGLIARDIWGMNAFFEIANQRSKSYLKAVRILQDGAYEGVLVAPKTAPKNKKK
ncbi:MAG: S41 family peptidase [Bacteroidaceae bacterium]